MWISSLLGRLLHPPHERHATPRHEDLEGPIPSGPHPSVPVALSRHVQDDDLVLDGHGRVTDGDGRVLGGVHGPRRPFDVSLALEAGRLVIDRTRHLEGAATRNLWLTGNVGRGANVAEALVFSGLSDRGVRVAAGVGMAPGQPDDVAPTAFVLHLRLYGLGMPGLEGEDFDLNFSPQGELDPACAGATPLYVCVPGAEDTEPSSVLLHLDARSLRADPTAPPGLSLHADGWRGGFLASVEVAPSGATLGHFDNGVVQLLGFLDTQDHRWVQVPA